MSQIDIILTNSSFLMGLDIPISQHNRPDMVQGCMKLLQGLVIKKVAMNMRVSMFIYVYDIYEHYRDNLCFPRFLGPLGLAYSPVLVLFSASTAPDPGAWLCTSLFTPFFIINQSVLIFELYDERVHYTRLSNLRAPH